MFSLAVVIVIESWRIGEICLIFVVRSETKRLIYYEKTMAGRSKLELSMSYNQTTAASRRNDTVEAGDVASSAVVATDGELLMRFTRHGDQQAFAQLVDAHAGLVWAVCGQVLHQQEDIEDAFQATFLILAVRGKDIRASDSAAGWLYRVAHRTSIALWRKNQSRPEQSLNGYDTASDESDPLERVNRQHTATVLMEELRTLPKRYQEPLILCYLEGLTHSAAAESLDLTTATVKGRLARGRRMLRTRLARRGIAMSIGLAVMSTAVVSASASPAAMSLGTTTAAAAGSFLKSPAASSGGASPIASSLAHHGASAMYYAALAKPALSLITFVAVGAGVLLANNGPLNRYASPAPFDLFALDGATAKAEEAAADARIAPAAPAAPDTPATETERPRVELEFATTDNDDDILVLRGNQQNVTQTQQRLMQLFAQKIQPMASTATAPLPGLGGDDASVEQLELEFKYWELRAEGLTKMAKAKRDSYQRSKTMFDRGTASGAELNKAEEGLAEAILQEADVYQAKAKMVEIKRRIERQKKAASVPQPATGWNFYQPQPAAAVPAYQPQPTTPVPASPPTPSPYGSAPQPMLAVPPPLSAPAPALSAEWPVPAPGNTIAPDFAFPAVDWSSDLASSLQAAKRDKRPLLIHFVSPDISAPCRKLEAMVRRTPAVQRLIAKRYRPVRIDVSKQPAVAKEYEVTRVPQVMVFYGEPRKSATIVAPPTPDGYLSFLQRFARDEHASMLLPGEVIKLTISKKRPREEQTQTVQRINESGYIDIPGTNRTCRIAGPEAQASNKVLAELRSYHEGYADAMDMVVEVERMEDAGDDQVLSSPTSLHGRPATGWSSPSQNQFSLQKQFEKLKKENAKLKKQLEQRDTEDAGGETVVGPNVDAREETVAE